MPIFLLFLSSQTDARIDADPDVMQASALRQDAEALLRQALTPEQQAAFVAYADAETEHWLASLQAVYRLTFADALRFQTQLRGFLACVDACCRGRERVAPKGSRPSLPHPDGL